ADGDQQDDEGADHPGARPLVVAPEDPLVIAGLQAGDPLLRLAARPEPHFWSSVEVPRLPGGFPMTCSPTGKGSFPAAHSRGLCPGEAGFGCGLDFRKLP